MCEPESRRQRKSHLVAPFKTTTTFLLRSSFRTVGVKETSEQVTTLYVVLDVMCQRTSGAECNGPLILEFPGSSRTDHNENVDVQCVNVNSYLGHIQDEWK